MWHLDTSFCRVSSVITGTKQFPFPFPLHPSRCPLVYRRVEMSPFFLEVIDSCVWHWWMQEGRKISILLGRRLMVLSWWWWALMTSPNGLSLSCTIILNTLSRSLPGLTCKHYQQPPPCEDAHTHFPHQVSIWEADDPELCVLTSPLSQFLQRSLGELNINGLIFLLCEVEVGKHHGEHQKQNGEFCSNITTEQANE